MGFLKWFLSWLDRWLHPEKPVDRFQKLVDKAKFRTLTYGKIISTEIILTDKQRKDLTTGGRIPPVVKENNE